MRVPPRQNISAKKRRQRLARIVGSELLEHARAPLGKHIRQEAEATSCADSWLRASRTCAYLRQTLSGKKQHARAPAAKHISQEAEATSCADSWLRASRACACAAAAAPAADAAASAVAAVVVMVAAPFSETVSVNLFGAQTTLCLAELLVRFLLKLVAKPRARWDFRVLGCSAVCNSCASPARAADLSPFCLS